jgi:excisionase family DNA binding protein
VNTKIKNKGEDPDALLTPEEIAARLKVGERTIERWQQDGTLPYLRLGQTVRFHWPTVVAHLLEHFLVCRLHRTGVGPAAPVKGGGR